MQKKDVKIGSTYLANVSGKKARVRITNESPYGGWVGENVETHRKVRIKTAGRLQMEIADPAAPTTTEVQPEPEAAEAIEALATTEPTPEPEAIEELEVEANEEPETELDAETELVTAPELEANEEPEPETEPDAATTATQAADTPPEEPTPDQEPEATTEALTAADRPLNKLTIEELRQVYIEAVGRETKSSNSSYLKWKIMQARKGHIPTGPRRQRTTAATGPHKVLPLRLEENLVQQLDEARKRLGLKSRMELFRLALSSYLDTQGEAEVAALFAPTPEA